MQQSSWSCWWWWWCSCGGHWRCCRGWAKFLRHPRCFLSGWCQVVHFYFRKHQLPGHRPGQHSFFLLWQKMCTDQRKQHQVCHLSLLASDITPPHSPTFKASPAFFVPLSHTLRRTWKSSHTIRHISLDIFHTTVSLLTKHPFQSSFMWTFSSHK